MPYIKINYSTLKTSIRWKLLYQLKQNGNLTIFPSPRRTDLQRRTEPGKLTTEHLHVKSWMNPLEDKTSSCAIIIHVQNQQEVPIMKTDTRIQLHRQFWVSIVTEISLPSSQKPNQDCNSQMNIPEDEKGATHVYLVSWRINKKMRSTVKQWNLAKITMEIRETKYAHLRSEPRLYC